MSRIRSIALGSSFALLAMGMAATQVQADQMEAAEVIVAEEIVEAVVEPCPDCPVNNGNVSFAMGNDITTAYYFRGLMQENKGFITQPWMEVGFTLWEAADQDAFISDIALVLGNWNSVQSEQTGSTPGTGAGNWYEADLYAGLSLGLSHGFSVGATYVAYAEYLYDAPVPSAFAGNWELEANRGAGAGTGAGARGGAGAGATVGAEAEARAGA